MDVKFVWLFAFTFLSKVIFTSSFETNVGHFQVRRRHREVWNCVNEILHHDEYVGASISDETGACEGLSHSWGRNQTIASGYGYARKISVKKTFEPQAEFGYGDPWTIDIPGILNTGARMDFHLTGQIEGSQSRIGIQLSEAAKSKEVSSRKIFTFSIEDTYNRIFYDESDGISYKNHIDFPDAFYHSTEWKISFVAQNKSLQVLLDDTVLKMIDLAVVRLNHLAQVSAFCDPEEYCGVFIRRFEFSEL